MKLVFQWTDDPTVIKKKVSSKDIFYKFTLIQTIMGWQLEVNTPKTPIVCYWGDYIMTDGHHHFYVYTPGMYHIFEEGRKSCQK